MAQGLSSSPLIKRQRPLHSGLRDYMKNGVITHQFSELESFRLLADAFIALCEAVNTPRSLACWILFREREYLQLVELELDPSTFKGTADQFQGDYLVSKIFSKYADFNIGVNKEDLAYQKWLLAEKECLRVNQNFRSRWAGGPIWDPDVEQVYHLARRFAQRVLGSELPSDILSHGGFGPGADTSTSENNISRYYKYATSGSGTPALMDLVSDYVGDDSRDWYVHDCELTNSSRLTFVPKTAKIDRAICIEPRWNIFYQLSAGHVIQRRLKRFGVDITDQNRNRDLASRAQVDKLATIDLSSASDTMSTNLIIDMLPEDWSDLLLKLRCPYTTYKGKRIRLEKISSMGNGYTFPLETLIFYSVGQGVLQHLGLSTEDLSVYGDDIIIPAQAYDLMVKVLTALGFSANAKKSFKDGRFFESCGADYFDGWNVRPLFIKKSIKNVQGAIRLVNQIGDFACRSGISGEFDTRYSAARLAVITRIPKPLRLFGPRNAGDSVIHAAFDECRPTLARNGWEGYTILGFVPTARLYDVRGDSLMYSKLDGPDAFGNNITKRDSTFLTVRRIYVPRYEGYLYS